MPNRKAGATACSRLLMFFVHSKFTRVNHVQSRLQAGAPAEVPSCDPEDGVLCGILLAGNQAIFILKRHPQTAATAYGRQKRGRGFTSASLIYTLITGIHLTDCSICRTSADSSRCCSCKAILPRLASTGPPRLSLGATSRRSTSAPFDFH